MSEYASVPNYYNLYAFLYNNSICYSYDMYSRKTSQTTESLYDMQYDIFDDMFHNKYYNLYSCDISQNNFFNHYFSIPNRYINPCYIKGPNTRSPGQTFTTRLTPVNNTFTGTLNFYRSMYAVSNLK